ncbi:hypothetical protein QWY75_06845 [Pontixanthobacter aestiaquae]|uniref:Uncharacterized protein n=1 Tax=Pontixanthobacter aestiaquae TaxID=1509367 RepID=A0A844Z7N1_9SPHN|nr:hypothetical protein [Pontixanthobacter aestiaquae]MDN3645919.1 hypothetical protein [Pontixanthobacter aestiaquae]MXO83087.1 hypothetical protein [Pontixanthobacter aestiaquae]
MKPLAPLFLFALAGCSQLSGSGPDYGRDEAIAGAAFRAEAFETYAKLNPVCPYTANTDQLARYAEPAERFQKLRDWVADTPFAVDLAIVEGRFNHFWSVNTAECGPTDNEESMAAFNAELEDLNRRLAALEKMAGMI